MPRYPAHWGALFLFILMLNAAGAAEPQTPRPAPARPAWAQEATPVTLPGTIRTRGGQRWLETAGGAAYALDESLASSAEMAGLDVEARGWTGRPAGGAATLLLTHPPVVLVPASWSIPFVLLLLCIACFPFISKHFWEHHYAKIACGLGALVLLMYVLLLGHHGTQRMLETGLDYFKFIALIGSLFVVTGGILVEVTGRGTPRINTLLLGTGAVLANLAGTTGAAALLIRPYLRINKERLRPFHVVLFIFIVANCGGVLTPIGDPPLFLGYLKGVPFLWTATHCWPAWLLAIGVLLCVFYFMDRSVPQSAGQEPVRVRISGWLNLVWLGLILFSVFLEELLPASLHAIPIGALVMLCAAWAAYKTSSPENLARNEFNFGPIREVAFLFAGIFAAMVPALDYLAAHAAKLGIATPGGFYFASGSLSAVLDNAPTYLNFLTAAFGLKCLALEPDNMGIFIAQHAPYLLAVSLGSVFFGACTYIGNGPNFMVKAIAEASGARTPGFFGYIVKYTLPILVPLYVLIWLLFIRQ